MLLKIMQVGEPVLRQPARQLSAAEILSAPIRNLIELMRETMRDAPGVGLAAPQIGESIQLAVVEDRQDYLDDLPHELLDDRARRAVPFHVLVNPRLTSLSDSRVEHFEGCLSVDGFAALVPRATHVRVDALDRKGKPVTIDAEGWYARILQHEIDHLHGQLYLDRMLSRTLTTIDNQSRYYAGMSAREVRALIDSTH